MVSKKRTIAMTHVSEESSALGPLPDKPKKNGEHIAAIPPSSMSIGSILTLTSLLHAHVALCLTSLCRVTAAPALRQR